MRARFGLRVGAQTLGENRMGSNVTKLALLSLGLLIIGVVKVPGDASACSVSPSGIGVAAHCSFRDLDGRGGDVFVLAGAGARSECDYGSDNTVIVVGANNEFSCMSSL